VYQLLLFQRFELAFVQRAVGIESGVSSVKTVRIGVIAPAQTAAGIRATKAVNSSAGSLIPRKDQSIWDVVTELKKATVSRSIGLWVSQLRAQKLAIDLTVATRVKPKRLARV
jgi:hypothetical protein